MTLEGEKPPLAELQEMADLLAAKPSDECTNASLIGSWMQPRLVAVSDQLREYEEGLARIIRGGEEAPVGMFDPVGIARSLLSTPQPETETR